MANHPLEVMVISMTPPIVDDLKQTDWFDPSFNLRWMVRALIPK